MLDLKVKEMRESWAQDGSITYQLIWDNWDKNILPSYRTSDIRFVQYDCCARQSPIP